jgi:hypothetical protein
MPHRRQAIGSEGPNSEAEGINNQVCKNACSNRIVSWPTKPMVASLRRKGLMSSLESIKTVLKTGVT